VSCPKCSAGTVAECERFDCPGGGSWPPALHYGLAYARHKSPRFGERLVGSVHLGPAKGPAFCGIFPTAKHSAHKEVATWEKMLCRECRAIAARFGLRPPEQLALLETTGTEKELPF
jgi:hypothetical protein